MMPASVRVLTSQVLVCLLVYYKYKYKFGLVERSLQIVQGR